MMLLSLCSRQRTEVCTSPGEMLCHSAGLNSSFLGKPSQCTCDELGGRAGLQVQLKFILSPVTTAQMSPKSAVC